LRECPPHRLLIHIGGSSLAVRRGTPNSGRACRPGRLRMAAIGLPEGHCTGHGATHGGSMSTALERYSGAHRRRGALTQMLRHTRLRVVTCAVLGGVLMGGCADDGVTTPAVEQSQQPSLQVSTGVATDLGTLGGARSTALGINSNGQVVGESETTSGNEHALLWQSGQGMQDLGTLGGDMSSATGINTRGEVVGYSFTASGQQHAFLWQSGQGMQDLGTFGGENSSALR